MDINDMELSLEYKQGTDPELTYFVQMVLLKTKAVIYAPVKPNIDMVQLRYDEFLLAASAAINGGTEAKGVRNEKRKNLEDGVEILGKDIIANSQGDPLYVTNAGLQLRNKPGAKSYVDFITPTFKKVVRGIQAGTVKGEVNLWPEGVTGMLTQWRIAGTEVFTPGLPTSGKRFELRGLPSFQRIEVQVRYFGTHGRQSDWSIPYPVDL